MMELINLYYCFAALAFTALVTQKLGSCPELRVEESPGNWVRKSQMRGGKARRSPSFGPAKGNVSFKASSDPLLPRLWVEIHF